MEILCIALQLYWLVMVIRILLSWATMVWSPPPSLSPAIRVIYDLTEPVLSLFRRYIPPLGAMDISPIFIFIILSILMGSVCGG